ncbi:FAD/NAD(P)-binding domain superfamily protein [Abortiporus biennis]
MSPTKIRVAICGGGIGGLTLAVALSKNPNVQVDVYEAAGQFKEIGAGVMLWDRTWKMLDKLGLSKDLAEVAHDQPNGKQGIGFHYRRSDTECEGFTFEVFKARNGCIRFHRAQFLDILVSHLPAGIAHFGKRLVSYQDASSPDSSLVQLLFADGSNAACDLLVGCDGIKSTVRKQMYEEAFAEAKGEEKNRLKDLLEPIVWSGTMAYRILIPRKTLEALNPEHRTLTQPMMHCGKSKHIVSYPIARGEIINFVGLNSNFSNEGKPFIGSWVSECTVDEVQRCYADWEPEVRQLLSCMEKSSLPPTKWAIHESKTLPFWTRGRVVLLGDAAHSMTPHQGAGAGQAIEDAYVLSSLLSTYLGSRSIPEIMEKNLARYPEGYKKLGTSIAAQWDWLKWDEPDEVLKNEASGKVAEWTPAKL